MIVNLILNVEIVASDYVRERVVYIWMGWRLIRNRMIQNEDYHENLIYDQYNIHDTKKISIVQCYMRDT